MKLDNLSKGQLYMNEATGSVDTYDGWFYIDIDGNRVNAVDRGEVFPVEFSVACGCYVNKDLMEVS